MDVVVARDPIFGVHIRAPDFWKLPCFFFLWVGKCYCEVHVAGLGTPNLLCSCPSAWHRNVRTDSCRYILMDGQQAFNYT